MNKTKNRAMTARASIGAAAIIVSLLVLAAPGNAEPIERVAVLPFAPDDASPPREGWVIAAKLAARGEGRRFITTVNWKSLGRLMDDNGLDRRRLRESAVVREIGRILKVDAVVSGSFVTRGGEWIVKASFVNVETGRVAGSRKRLLSKDVIVSVPELVVDAPVFEEGEGLRDALADFPSPCDGAAGRVDALEKSILDLKARYWALQLKGGLDLRSLTYNPGTIITDPELKRLFYTRMKQWYAQDTIPTLHPTEAKTFAKIDERAFRLARDCGIL